MKSTSELQKATIEELSIYSILKSMSEKSILQISEVLLPMYMPNGGVIHRIGKKEKYLFLLKQGSVSIKTNIPNQGLTVIRRVQPTEVFGHSALLQRSTRKLSFIAEGETSLYVLPTYLHQWAMERGMQWAMEIQRVLCIHLIQQMRRTLDKLKYLAQAEEDNLEEQQEEVFTEKRKALEELLYLTEISSTNDLIKGTLPTT